MTEDKTCIPVRIAATKYTCADCTWFRPKTGKCGKKTKCGGVIVTDAKFKACVNFIQNPKKILADKERADTFAALKVLSKEVDCQNCVLSDICKSFKASDCIRGLADMYVIAAGRIDNKKGGF